MTDFASFQHNDSNLTSNSEFKGVFGPDYHRTVRIVIIAIMIVVSLTGNLMVCWRLFVSQRGRHSKPKVLFLNLAVADLLVTMVTMTAQVVWEVMGRLWIAGDIFCRFFKLLQTFALVSSTYMLVIIALDRYYVIVYPLRPCISSWKLALIAWSASLIPSIPNLYIFREIEVDENQSFCSSLFYTGKYPRYHRQIYMAFVFLTVFIVPFSLLVALYSRILLEIWRQSSAVNNRQQTGSSLPRAKVKTLKMTMAIFVAFMITNLPYVVQEMVLAFGNPKALDENTVALFGVISASNSAINPCIYLLFQSQSNGWTRFNSCLKTMKKSSLLRIRSWRTKFSYRTTSLTSFHQNTDVFDVLPIANPETIQLTIIARNKSLMKGENYV